MDGLGSIFGKGKATFLSVQTVSEAQPATYLFGTGGSSFGGTAHGSEADHSPPPSTQTKNGGVIFPIPHTSSWGRAYFLTINV
jgi:hypothetical protein